MQHYKITCVAWYTQDGHLVDLYQFSYSGANITAFRLIDPERPQVVDVRTDWVLMMEASEDTPLDTVSSAIRVGCLYSQSRHSINISYNKSSVAS